jgi:hypothetical protein
MQPPILLWLHSHQRLGLFVPIKCGPPWLPSPDRGAAARHALCMAKLLWHMPCYTWYGMARHILHLCMVWGARMGSRTFCMHHTVRTWAHPSPAAHFPACPSRGCLVFSFLVALCRQLNRPFIHCVRWQWQVCLAKLNHWPVPSVSSTHLPSEANPSSRPMSIYRDVHYCLAAPE